MAGNPNFIAAGWGEATKAIKLPTRLCDRIQELREDGEDTDDILGRLDNEQDYSNKSDEFDLDEIVELLQEALTLKSNAGGAIKSQIRKVLQLLGADED